MGTSTRVGARVRKLSTPRIHDLVIRHLNFVEGLENIPREGPVVFVANHSSYMDHFVTKTLANAVRPGRVWFPTKAEAFETPLSRIWHESMDCYPVDRSAPGDEVFRLASQVLDGGNTLVLYPEGTRGDAVDLMPFKTGAFRMALASKAPVIPIGMTGLADVLPKGASLPRRRLLSVSIGEPLAIPDTGDAREDARSMRDEAVASVEALRQRSSSPSGPDIGAALDSIIDLATAIAAENLDPRGTLDAETIDRLELLLRIADKTSARRLDLNLQRARLEGFRALRAPGPVRMARAALVNRKAQRLSDLHASSDFAAYLAGRSSLMLPRALGGGTEIATLHFERSVQRAGAMRSQALIGLGEAHAAAGRSDEAKAAYERGRDSISPGDPRGQLRRERIDHTLKALARGEVR